MVAIVTSFLLSGFVLGSEQAFHVRVREKHIVYRIHLAACEKYIIARYLGTRLDAENKKVFDELYTEYIEFISREFSDDPVPNGNY